MYPCIANMTKQYIRPSFNFLDVEKSYTKKILEEVFDDSVKKYVPVNIIINFLVSNAIYPENLWQYRSMLLRIKIAFSTQLNQTQITAHCPYCNFMHTHGKPTNNIGFYQPNCTNNNYIVYVNQEPA